MTTDFKAARGARLAAIAKIRSGVSRDKQRNKTSLMHTMSAHNAAIKKGLRDIFGTAAFTRGAAEELIEAFRDKREKIASDLRDQLESSASALRETVGEQLSHMAAARMKAARREGNARRAQIKDLRRRVDALLANARKLMETFSQDRQHAGHAWDQYMRSAAPPQRRAATRATAKDVATPHKPAARKTAKKRKHARG
jgi:DNA anti-recombination protein RmuC